MSPSDRKKLWLERPQARFEANPLSKAVKGVLFASSAAVAMTVPGFAQAAIPGGCSTVGEVVTCVGAITDPVGTSSVNDLTIIVGDAANAAATSVVAPADSDYAVSAESTSQDATVVNNSSITNSNSVGNSHGVQVFASDDATLTNNGSISNTNTFAGSRSIAAYANGGDEVVVTNAGDISQVTTASAAGGQNEALGVYARGSNEVSVVNDGSISATSTTTDAGAGRAEAYGILVDVDSDGGDISVSGSGTGVVDATATTTDGRRSYSWGVVGWGEGDTYVGNQTVSATAVTTNTTQGSYTNSAAYGVKVYSDDSSSTVANLTSVTSATATAVEDGVSSWAGSYGVYADAQDDVTLSGVYSVATGAATSGDYGEARADVWGVHADAEDGDVSISDTTATAIAIATSGDYAESDASAFGIDAEGDEGDVNLTTVTSSAIATATSGAYSESYAEAFGVYAETDEGDITLSYVTGAAVSSATSGVYGDSDAEARGIEANTDDGDVTLSDSSGTATAAATSSSTYGEASADAWGVDVYSESDLTVTNVTGTATATSYSATWSEADTEGVDLTAEDDITASNITGYATSTATATNSYGWGADAEATGIEFYSEYGDVTATDLLAVASATATDTTATYGEASANAWGVYAEQGEIGDISLTNVDATATATATALGSDARADAEAQGIYAWADGGNVTISGAAATGAAVSIAGDSYSESAWANSDSYGIYAVSEEVVTVADSTATAVSTSTVGDNLSSYNANASASSWGVYAEGGDVTAISNTTAMASSTATAGDSGNSWAGSYGVYANAESGDVAISGVDASANAIAMAGMEGYAEAVSVGVSGFADDAGQQVDISDTIGSASAAATVTSGYATAASVGVYGGGNGYSEYAGATEVSFMNVTGNASSIASSDMVAGYADAEAVGVQAADREGGKYGPDVSINGASANVMSEATGYNASALAVGVSAGGYAYGEFGGSTSENVSVVTNASDVISAVANADGAYADSLATGVYAVGDAVEFINNGSISAYASGTASAVPVDEYAPSPLSVRAEGVSAYSFDSPLTVVNNGSISAATSTGNDAFAIVADSAYGGVAIINNGTLTGGVMTGDGDDTLTNNSPNTWNITNDSFFGAGSDTINNSATGRIQVMGDHTIYMGDDAYDVDTFVNDGSLSFYNDAVGDVLTIDNVESFEGSGSATFDVDLVGAGFGSVSDRLYIVGDVAPDAAITVNSHLTTIPSGAGASITDVIDVSGVSTAANFLPGVVTTRADSFLDFDLSLISDIDAPSDIFSLAISLDGLSDVGVTVSSLAPAIQSMWHSTVGTLVQRQGAVRDQSLDGVSVWARYINNSGDIDPSGDLTSNGEFSIDTDGFEIGADIALGENFRLGLMASQTDADMDLNDGVGDAEIDADTFGVYLTWLSGPWTADLSYRDMDFDGDLKSRGLIGSLVDGDADGINLEVGYTIDTDSGWVIEPQLQYSNVDVDLDDIGNSYGKFTQDDADSTLGRLGVAFRKTYQKENSAWTPYFSLNVLEEFEADNKFTVNGVSDEASTDGTSFLVEGGVSATIKGVIVYGGLNYVDGDAQDSLMGGQIGVRYAF